MNWLSEEADIIGAKNTWTCVTSKLFYFIDSGENPHDLSSPGGHNDVTSHSIHYIYRLYPPENMGQKLFNLQQ